MGIEARLKPSLVQALEGRWGEVDYDSIRDTCRLYRDGSDANPGSDNHSTLAYGCAIVIAWKRPDLLHRIDLTRQQVVSWWERELTVRLRKGLQLVEERSRIYVEWEAALICWLYRAFVALGLSTLHLRYVRATSAQVALCAYPAKPRRYEPDNVEAKLYDHRLFVPLAGARSWSGEREGGVLHAHHLGQSGWEPFASHLLGMPIPREFEWHRRILAKLRPGWMGMSSGDIAILRGAIREGKPIYVDDLAAMLDGVGTRWPCRLVRFKRGSACIGVGRAINGNTAPIYAMAIHGDGTVHLLTLDPGNRHDIDLEPCGVKEFAGGDRVKYVAWAGGEGRDQREMLLTPERWGRVLWDVHLHRDGNHVVRRPKPETPVPPGPGPGPPDDDRDWFDYPGVWLTKLWRWLERRF